MALTLGELADRLSVETHGDANCIITGVATLQHAEKGALTFLANPHYRKYLADTAASAVILRRADLSACPVSALVSDNPYAADERAAELKYPPAPAPRGVHPSACVSAASQIHDSAWIGPHCVVEAGARIEDGAYIGPGCTVGENVVVGADSRLQANVTLCRGTRIGRRALIHPGVVIGSDGFGFAQECGAWVKVPQLGGVRIGDDVEIGANTTVDRGALEDTVIEDGVKLDNQIQIAHNVHIGAHTAIAGCVGIAGSTRIGRRCTVGGAAGIAGHLEIADDVHITAMSMVIKSIAEPGVYSSGLPAEPNREWRKNYLRFCQLDELARRLHTLEKKLDGNE
ncbi:MAG: UDP-3-O-(3-hydroxymyristoyl)glucosamine N-acyltransferase [Gammaproteobacteria bacterium]|nr:UDP-3-O-(3-hydroxymyristoyl)glucosamine N-acyltransferase [Gammaproteobacteria bacterium]